MSAGSVVVGQTGVERAKATSKLRELDILKVNPNHFFQKTQSFLSEWFWLFIGTGTLLKARVYPQGPRGYIKPGETSDFIKEQLWEMPLHYVQFFCRNFMIADFWHFFLQAGDDHKVIIFSVFSQKNKTKTKPPWFQNPYYQHSQADSSSGTHFWVENMIKKFKPLKQLSQKVLSHWRQRV